jgi:hypothetical protein
MSPAAGSRLVAAVGGAVSAAALLTAATACGADSGHGAAPSTSTATANPTTTPAPGSTDSAAGYTLGPIDAPAAANTPGVLRFRITGPDGKPVTRFDTAHDKQLHLIAVRSDTSQYRHVHPTMAPDGTWSIDWTWPVGGTYRVFADFVPAGGPGEQVLARQVDVTGDAASVPVPPPAPVAEVDGYQVRLDGALSTAGGMMNFTVTKDGAPITDLDRYLGAYGHLVALRLPDLAYLHVHPLPGPSGPTVGFHAAAPSPGQYRLFLDFSHHGTVHTAVFTAEATNAEASTGASSMPEMPGMPDHH